MSNLKANITQLVRELVAKKKTETNPDRLWVLKIKITELRKLKKQL